MGTLQHIQHQIVALNDLIKTNNDRISGYKKAILDTEDSSLKSVFESYADQSKEYVGQLNDYIHHLGGSPTDGTTLSGKFHNTWMDMKAALGKPSSLSLLSDCERVEDVVKVAYRKALDDKELIFEDDKLLGLLNEHLSGLKMAHDAVKALRDTESLKSKQEA